MKEKVTPYKNSSLNKKEQVELMFDTISGNYDDLNRVISLGTDTMWRRKVIKMVADRNPESILDIATGTGDLAIKFATATQANRIIGLDISEGMLSMAKKKISGSEISEKLVFVQGDSEALNFVNAPM